MRTEVTTHGKIEAPFTRMETYFWDTKGSTQFHFCILVSHDCVALARVIPFSHTHIHTHARAHTFSFFFLHSEVKQAREQQIAVTADEHEITFRIIPMLPSLRRSKSNYCKFKLLKNRPIITTRIVGGGSRDVSLSLFFSLFSFLQRYHVSTTCK